jgi:hypothetical protein
VTLTTEEGMPFALATYGTVTRSDNVDAEPSVVCDVFELDEVSIGSTNVTCSASDESLNTASCTFVVTVVDDEKPTFDCPADIVLTTTLNEASGLLALPRVEVSDNSGEDITALITGYEALNLRIGEHTLTVEAADTADNTRVCNFQVTVVDLQNPTLDGCPVSVTGTTNPKSIQGVARWPSLVASDNSGMADVTCSRTSGVLFDAGTTPVLCVATDPSNNTASCSFDVVISDGDAPTVACPQSSVLRNDGANGELTAALTYLLPSVVDNLDEDLAATCSPATGTPLDVGSHRVECIAIDSANNRGSCAFSVVVEDNRAPIIACPDAPAAVALPADSAAVAVDFALASASTPLGSVTTTCNHASGAAFNVGTTEVTCAANNDGFTATCFFNVEVTDSYPPVFECPDDQVLGTDIDSNKATVIVTEPTVTNNDGSVQMASNVGDSFLLNVGATKVVWFNATDASGNTASCSYSVTVVDQQAPTITCPNSLRRVLAADENTTALGFNQPAAQDNVGVTQRSCTIESTDRQGPGDVLVTCSASDAATLAASCTFNVTVVDEQPPVVTCPDTITKPADFGTRATTVSYETTAADNLGVVSIECDRPSEDNFAVGTTTVRCSAFDQAGNRGQCSFNVVVRDNTPPSVTCPAGLVESIGYDDAIFVTYGPAVATDDSGADGVTLTYDQASGSSFSLGVHTITATATDAAANVGTCNFTITVADSTAPELVCPEQVETTTEQGEATGVLPAATATEVVVTDNVDGTSLLAECDTLKRLSPGEGSAECTAVDAAGNVGRCQIMVLVRDEEAPIMPCSAQTSMIGSINATGLLWYPLPDAQDNVDGKVDVACVPAPLTAVTFGMVAVTCQTMDAAQNPTSCSFEVDVQVGPVDCIGNYDAWSECDKCPTHERFRSFITIAQPSNGGEACLGTQIERCSACIQLIFTSVFSEVNLEVLQPMEMSELEAIFLNLANDIVGDVDPAAVVAKPVVSLSSSRRRELGSLAVELTIDAAGTPSSIQKALRDNLLDGLRAAIPGAVGETSTVSVAEGSAESKSSSSNDGSIGMIAGGAAAGLVVLVVVLAVLFKRRSSPSTSSFKESDTLPTTDAHTTVMNPLYDDGVFDPTAYSNEYEAEEESPYEEHPKMGLSEMQEGFGGFEDEEDDEYDEDDDIEGYLEVDGDDPTASALAMGLHRANSVIVERKMDRMQAENEELRNRVDQLAAMFPPQPTAASDDEDE